MRLALNLGYHGTGLGEDALPVTLEAERLGYAVAWVAEAYGSDAATTLGWLAGQTTRIGLGSAVFQIPGRSAAMTAMTAATLDHLSGGRMHLGLGVSGPQVSEGWHGVRFAQPLARTREYVDVVRMALARERVEYAGRHLTLPLPDGLGKALRLTIRPVQRPVPLYLAAVGPRSLELAGEIADGWLGVFFAPEAADDTLAALRRGRARGGHEGLEGFDLVPTVPVCLTENLDLARMVVAAYTALYVGGMGAREKNVYFDLACRLGFATEARRIQDAFLDGRHRDAADAVPFELVDATALVGSRDRVGERLARYAAAGVTTLTVSPFALTLQDRLATVRTMAEILDESGLADPATQEGP